MVESSNAVELQPVILGSVDIAKYSDAFSLVGKIDSR